jgi:hypothetical protein
MKQVLVGVLLLAVAPMVLLNPLGREAFIGYYVGAIAVWFAFVCAGKWQRSARP